MKSTGIVRNTDKVGRIVLPIELRQTLYIAEGDPLEIYTEEDKIILKNIIHPVFSAEAQKKCYPYKENISALNVKRTDGQRTKSIKSCLIIYQTAFLYYYKCMAVL